MQSVLLSAVLRIFVWSSTVLLSIAAHAEFKPHALFCENAVLPQGVPVPVWGTAVPGDAIAVEFAGQKKTAVTGSDGKWSVTLDPMKASSQRAEMIFTCTNPKSEIQNLKVRNILVGEVWICSGQSNMAFEMAGVRDAAREAAEANFPQIRMWQMRHGTSLEPREDCTSLQGKWVVASPTTVGPFSAVGYFFARDLHRTLGVPVGMINTSWGATSAAQWTSEEALLAEPKLKPVMDFKRKVVNDYIQSVLKLVPELQAWKTETEAALAQGRAPQMPPYIQQRFAPDPLNLYTHLPAAVYNWMLHPITPAAIRGVIWYQGEQDASQAELYRTGFPTLIRDWRQRFRNPALPFLYVQISTINAPTDQPQERSQWAELREVQTACLDVPHTAMVVSADLGEVNDPHPRNKQDVGNRLARAARATVYGEKIVYQGPTFQRMQVEKGKIRIHFEHLHGGLVTKDKQPPKGFAIAGEDKKFVWAKAKLDGNTVLVWSESVPQPVAVRYAWADMPLCNLTNKEGLPLVPFRTHPW